MPFQMRDDGTPILANAGESRRLDDLQRRLDAGDPAAREELLRLAHADTPGEAPQDWANLEVNRAREMANKYLGTDLKMVKGGGWLNDFVSNDLGDLHIGCREWVGTATATETYLWAGVTVDGFFE